ncbi:hypothetical protein Dimus_008203 [Dionaea muscipula]
MGTFRAPHLMMPEVNRGTPMPHFTWFYPENYLSTARTAFNPFQPSEINPEIGFTALPIRSAEPTSEAARDVNMASDPIPIPSKKQKISREATDMFAANTSPHKQIKREAKKSKKRKATTQTVTKREWKQNLDLVLNDTGIDISAVPPPVCTCTGVPRQCYRWGAGRWQSSCCTTNISQYPLPMSPSRPGTRMSGRKMSHGAYVKLLQRLASEGHDLSHPVDLKLHWARHGTNKFVTIRSVTVCLFLDLLLGISFKNRLL